MTGRKGRISPRSRIYFGCEVSSEVGFGRIIQDLADIAKLHIHIDTDDFGTRAGSMYGSQIAEKQIGLEKFAEQFCLSNTRLLAYVNV